MKKSFFVGIMGICILTVSCASKKQSKTTSEQSSLKGEWVISSIEYDKKYKIKPFDEGADAQCFVGSLWKLVPNNYSGSYTINTSPDCPSVMRTIKFEIKEQNQFMFKKINEATKAKENSTGYTLTVLSISDTSFSLQQNIPFEGSTIQAVYNFRRVSTK